MVLVEAAIDSFADAERAVAEGAGRLEVCSRLDLGGLTPSSDLVRSCRSLGVRCVAMARSRPGDFHYVADEERRLIADVEAMRDGGADGVVFGVLLGDGRLDASITRDIVGRCAGIETVFHRAFDQSPDPLAALESLIDCGVTRVLTSGHAPNAVSGIATLASLVRHAAGRIQVLPGGGVRAGNVLAIVEGTGATEVHARATDPGVIAAIVTALSFRTRSVSDG